MTALLPRTLFGRLMLVLAGGLVLAQLASLAINLRERDSVLVRAMGMRPAQRIADVVKVLDVLSPAERTHISSVLNVPPLVVSLDVPPEAESSATQGAAHAGVFAAVLRSAVGDDRPIRVTLRGAPGPRLGKAWGGPGRGMGGPGFPGPSGGEPGAGPSMFVQVRLRDGTWATFDTRVPESSGDLPWQLVSTLAVLLAAVLVLSWIAVRLVTRPLKVLSAAADDLGRDLHRPPLPETGPAEVARAARAFNTMQQRLVATIEERMRMLTAMSHDLKTPITRMRLRADLLDDEELRGRFEADLREMEAMVTQALEFMRGESAHEPEEPVDIVAVLQQVAADNAAMGRSVTVRAHPVPELRASPRLLKRCIANLVDNAAIYGKGAEIEIEDHPDRVEIRVRDHGLGIPERDLERVFEPFFRLDPSRSRETGGTGLGLSIARNIARAHGGDVRLRNAAGGGLEAILTLARH